MNNSFVTQKNESCKFGAFLFFLNEGNARKVYSLFSTEVVLINSYENQSPGFPDQDPLTL